MTLRVLAAALHAALLVLTLAARFFLALAGACRPVLTRRAAPLLLAALAPAVLVAWPRLTHPPEPRAGGPLAAVMDAAGQAGGGRAGWLLRHHQAEARRARLLIQARPRVTPAPSPPVPSPAANSPSSPPAPVAAPAGNPQAYAASLLAGYGWGQDQMGPCLVPLWDQESGWRWNATNPSSGAYGIPQALPGSKMASAGADWRTDPDTQIRWGLGYIKGLYGSPCSAWAHEQADGWY